MEACGRESLNPKQTSQHFIVKNQNTFPKTSYFLMKIHVTRPIQAVYSECRDANQIGWLSVKITTYIRNKWGFLRNIKQLVHVYAQTPK